MTGLKEIYEETKKGWMLLMQTMNQSLTEFMDEKDVRKMDYDRERVRKELYDKAMKDIMGDEKRFDPHDYARAGILDALKHGY
jgi:hypothetical protein